VTTQEEYFGRPAREQGSEAGKLLPVGSPFGTERRKDTWRAENRINRGKRRFM